MGDEEEGDRVVELQPMLDSPVQPPLLLVSRGRQSSKQALLPKDAVATMLHNLVLICTWCEAFVTQHAPDQMWTVTCSVQHDRHSQG